MNMNEVKDIMCEWVKPILKLCEQHNGTWIGGYNEEIDSLCWCLHVDGKEFVIAANQKSHHGVQIDVIQIWLNDPDNMVISIDRNNIVRNYPAVLSSTDNLYFTHKSLLELIELLLLHIDQKKNENAVRRKEMKSNKFIKEVIIKKFDTSCFETGAAYLFTPIEHPEQKFIGIYMSGTEDHLDINSSRGSHMISIVDADKWQIEKMIEPMTDAELHLLHDLIIKYAIGCFGANDDSNKNITDNILNKLGLAIMNE